MLTKTKAQLTTTICGEEAIKEYKDALKKEFRGLYYDRFILGKWVLAEGTVYDFLQPRINILIVRRR